MNITACSAARVNSGSVTGAVASNAKPSKFGLEPAALRGFPSASLPGRPETAELPPLAAAAGSPQRGVAARAPHTHRAVMANASHRASVAKPWLYRLPDRVHQAAVGHLLIDQVPQAGRNLVPIRALPLGMAGTSKASAGPCPSSR